MNSSLVNGIILDLSTIYENSLTEATGKHGRNIALYFSTHIKASGKEEAMNSYLKLVVLLGIPLSYVENEIIRDFSKYDVIISSNLDSTGKRAEVQSKDVTKGSQGAILYDSWTHNGIL